MPSNKLKRDPDADVAALISVLRNDPDQVFGCVDLRVRSDVPKEPHSRIAYGPSKGEHHRRTKEEVQIPVSSIGGDWRTTHDVGNVPSLKLRVIEEWAEGLRQNPREDMPGSKPSAQCQLWWTKRQESLRIEQQSRESLVRQQRQRQATLCSSE